MSAVIERSAPSAAASGFTAMVVAGPTQVRTALVARLQAIGAADVAEAASLGEARARARAGGPRDIAVVDVALPDGPGLQLLVELRTAGWSRLVVVSESAEPHVVRAAFVAGADGYLLRSAAPTAVAEGMRRVLDGEQYADPTIAYVPEPPAPDRARLAVLSQREVEVLRLVADGRSNKQIGGALGLSPLTAKSHLARIGRKLGTGDRAEMVALAMRAGLIL